jgi:hypothetical protein
VGATMVPPRLPTWLLSPGPCRMFVPGLHRLLAAVLGAAGASGALVAPRTDIVGEGDQLEGAASEPRQHSVGGAAAAAGAMAPVRGRAAARSLGALLDLERNLAGYLLAATHACRQFTVGALVVVPRCIQAFPSQHANGALCCFVQS